MTALRRGFKSWSETTALQVRRQFRVAPAAPLPGHRLAELQNISLWTPNDLPMDAAVRERLCGKHKSVWSAFTLPTTTGHVIVFNPEHTLRRQSNDIMHELAHILLEHTPGNMFFGANGVALRSHDKVQEEEAKWLAGALLLPRESLFAIRRLRLTDEEACERYEVSEAILAFRFSVTAVDKQLAFAKRRSSAVPPFR